MEDRKLNIEDEKHYEWIVSSYNKLLGDYIFGTSITEALINFSIAKLLKMDGEQADLFVKIVIMEFSFWKKFNIYKKLLKEKHLNIYNENKTSIDRFSTLFIVRNTLAHSFVAIDAVELGRKDKSKIAYRNVSNNLNEKIYLDLRIADEEVKELQSLNYIFKKIDECI